MKITFKSGLQRWKIPLFYLGLLIINFGIYIPWWGLYGDDWQYLYSYHLLGIGGAPAFVAPDRPFSAWVYMLFPALLGENAWAYHILLLLLRWMAGVLLWKVLKALWPEHGEAAFWAGAVLVVYPGFKQQPLPLEFILHFSILNLTLFSLYSMLRSIDAKNGSRKWNLFGLVSALGIFSVEYFTGLELLRPVLLWIKLRKSIPRWQDRFRAVLLRWLPYLAVLLAFVFWRVFIFQFQHYKPSASGISNPLKFFINTGWKAIDSIWLAVKQSWAVEISLKNGLPAAFAMLAALLASFVLLSLVLRKVYPKPPVDQTETGADASWIVGLGLIALVLAGPLYWILDIPIQPGFPWDRPLLSFIPGAAILLGGAAVKIIIPRYRSYLLAGLCAAALIANYQNASSFIQEWQNVRSYLDQLTRRIPQVAPGTTLMTQKLPFLYYGENTFFPMLNWIYSPENHTPQMHLRMFDLSIRQGGAVAELERGEGLSHDYRSFHFQGTSAQVIAFTYQPPACLHVLSPDDADYPYLEDWLRDLLYLSNPTLVQSSPEKPAELPSVMARPAPRGWCTTYQEAELARHQQDWEAVRAAAAAAESQGLKPQVGYEYLPFIEAFARDGSWDRVEAYFGLAKTQDPESNHYLCGQWRKFVASLEQEAAGRVTEQYCTE